MQLLQDIYRNILLLYDATVVDIIAGAFYIVAMLNPYRLFQYKAATLPV